MPRWTSFWAALREILSGKPAAVPRRASVAGNAGGGRIRIVALLAGEEDRELLARLAGEQDWMLYPAASCGEAWTLLNQHKAPLVICDRDFPGTEWRDVIQMMSSASHLVYAILVSRVADDYLWSEVIRHGGYDLVAAPLREEKLLRAVRLGWSYWNSANELQGGLPPLPLKHYR